MYNDIIKLLNWDQFNLKILKADTIKKDNKLLTFLIVSVFKSL